VDFDSETGHSKCSNRYCGSSDQPGRCRDLLEAVWPQAIYAIRYCYLGWCHVRGVSFVHGGETGEFVTHIQYNSRGLRDYEYGFGKPPGSRRILIFGDSFTEGLEVEMRDLVAKQLERLFSRCFPDQAVQVTNFGVSTYDAAQKWWYFNRFLTTEIPIIRDAFVEEIIVKAAKSKIAHSLPD